MIKVNSIDQIGEVRIKRKGYFTYFCVYSKFLSQRDVVK